MKLVNLIPLREVEDTSTPELIATPYFREFQTTHGYKPLFKYLGTKNDQHIFVADLTDFGMLDLVIKDAQIMAKVTEKEGVFGMIYTLTGLEKFDATICKMKQKDGQIEHVMFDDKNKKEFDAQTNKFLDLISQVK
jgi:hypothetical protein